jgi:hypothetical protein
MPMLDEQLRAYGAFLDDYDGPEDDVAPEPTALVAPVPPRPRRAFVAIATLAAIIAVIAATGIGREATVELRTAGTGTSRVPTGAAPPAESVADLLGENPTFAQQVARLEGWYRSAVAEAPGGRPILEAEAVFCAYPAAPRMNFASTFPLTADLNEARLVEACLAGDGSTGVDAQTPHQLCATQARGPIYDPAAVPSHPATKPIVVFGTTTCSGGGSDPAPPGFLDALNARRRVEIELRAVPRSCPTEAEATAWVGKVTTTRLGGPAWSMAPLATTPRRPGECFRPELVDWDLQRVALGQFVPAAAAAP